MRESLALIWDYASRCLHSLALVFLAAVMVGVALTSNTAPRTVQMYTRHDVSAVESPATTTGSGR